jgi:hypothetical protein
LPLNGLLSSKVAQRLALKGKAAKHRSAKLKNKKINLATGKDYCGIVMPLAKKSKTWSLLTTFFDETSKFFEIWS